MVDYGFSGLNPVAYHVSNFMLHGLTAFVLYCILLLLTGSTASGLIGALLFVSHPVHSDSVAYMSGRRDILSTLFFLSGFYSFVRYRMTGKVKGLIGAGLFFLLSIGSKEMAVTLPAVCMLYDVTLLYEKTKKQTKEVIIQSLKSYGVFLVIGGGFLLYKLVLFYPSLKQGLYGGNVFNHAATVLRIIGRYLQVTFFPVVLHADYSYNSFPVSKSFFNLEVLFLAFLIIGILLVIFKVFKYDRFVLLGGMWFFITLLPVCHIFPHHELLAEHYLYLPSIGIIILFTPLWEYLFAGNKTPCLIILIVILSLFSVRTVVRNRDWRNGMSLWSKVIETAPECARAHDNLGREYYKRKNYEKAILHYERAVNLRPNHAVARNNLGTAYGMTGRFDKAEKEFLKAVSLYQKLEKNYRSRETVSLNNKLAEVLESLGMVYYKKKEYEKAADFFRESIERQPRATRWYHCGYALMKAGHIEQAIESFKQSLRHDWNLTKAYRALGTALRKNGEPEEAIKAYLHAAKLEPENAKIYYRIGIIYLNDFDNLENALHAFEKCIEINPEMNKAHKKLEIVRRKMKDKND